MTLLETTILALIRYRKKNGYTRTIHLCSHGAQMASCKDCWDYYM